MSKYTTEVRYICENKSGLNESVGFNNVDDVISKSWDKIFTTKTQFFDENYRSVLCRKILKHFYLREIGAETFGVWSLWMNTRLEEVMPYYNQLYKSALLEFNPLYDVDLTREHNKGNTEKGTTTNSDTVNSTSNVTGTERNLYSDTPQGAITGLENENYLTNARKINNNNNTTNNTTSNGNSSNNINSTEEYLETVRGKQGSGSYSSLLQEYRETFLNIDLQVINEFNDLFMNLW